ncbi:rhomboid family intramembrane serine protease [Corynebacterium pseudopelargi]|uniref:Rhomboid protease GluP n=1 Tax=Corynebacterium pseudopelargi TaxID=2080757 RepID=A0A3G6IRM0_9CORY|nr:rhomboid family intramembrane serine protease [Corynebacterium pseudopelargi]AZA08177.1 Rhomboid protease GluP [Corynebacterium pseudopelargi]
MSSLTQSIKRFARPAPVTAVILGFNLLAYAFSAVQSRSWLSPLDASSFAQDGILYAPLMHQPIEWLRAITSSFLHIDPTHLGFNMLMLILIGREVEKTLGSVAFLGTYLACGVGGSLAVMLQAPLAPTVGASGALYGLMAVFVAICMRTRSQVTPALVLIAVNFGYTLITPNISLWGHIGGFFSGAVIGLLFFTRFRLSHMVWVLFGAELLAVAYVGNSMV